MILSELELSDKARLVRKKVLQIIHRAGSGHPGGSLSAVDLCTVLFFNSADFTKSGPARDRFILSKGHAAPLLYVLFSELGFCSEKDLLSFRQMDSTFQGHPHSLKCQNVEISTGSLGQGLSIACGISLAATKDNMNFKVYVLVGDGELDEGQIWEAAMFASHYKLKNLIVVVDRNGLQIDGETEKVMQLEPLEDKWKSFGWYVQAIDGHSISEIIDSIEKAKKSNKPNIIIAKTVKGKGVSFMENKAEWHGKAPDKGELELALRELN